MTIKSFEEMILPKGMTVEEIIQQSFKDVADLSKRHKSIDGMYKAQEESIRRAWLARENQTKPATLD